MRLFLLAICFGALAGCVTQPLADDGDGGVDGGTTGAGGQPTLFADHEWPSSLALDATNLYWTTQKGEIVRRALDGSGDRTVLASGQLKPWAIALDATSVYWVAGLGEPGSTVSKTALDGSGAVTTLATGLITPYALAVDGANVYWETTDGNVMRASTSGGSPTVMATGQDQPQDLAVDADTLYWLTLATVMKMPKAGGAMVELAAKLPGGQSLTLDADHVYWSTAQGTIGAVDKNGAGLTTLASGLGIGANSPYCVVADGTGAIYWTNGGNDVVERMVPPSPTRTLVAAGQNFPDKIVANATSLYWFDGGGDASGVTIWTIAKP